MYLIPTEGRCWAYSARSPRFQITNGLLMNEKFFDATGFLDNEEIIAAYMAMEVVKYSLRINDRWRFCLHNSARN